jgi:hypothetical protein
MAKRRKNQVRCVHVEIKIRRNFEMILETQILTAVIEYLNEQCKPFSPIVAGVPNNNPKGLYCKGQILMAGIIDRARNAILSHVIYIFCAGYPQNGKELRRT